MTEAREVKRRPNRTKSKRHPFLQDRPKGVWYPDAVGVVPHYPKTLEAFEKRKETGRKIVAALKARGAWCGRKGVPDGWAGRKDELVQVRQRANEEAKRIVKTMVEKGIISEDDKHAQEALEGLVAIVRAKDEKTGMPAHGARETINAAKAILEFTKAKPASTVVATVNKAEDFLALLAREPE